MLPTTQDGVYATPEAALLADGKELTEFLSSEDIQSLYSKRHWLDTNITGDKTRELRDYLTTILSIEELNFSGFVSKLSKPFLETKHDDWMVVFYARLLKREGEAVWSNLRTKPIIRWDNKGHNDHIEAFNKKNEALVYLPSQTGSNYKTVKKELAENESAMNFFAKLGLTKPDLLSEIREFILPKYQKGDTNIDEAYYEDFEKLLKGYETPQSNERNKIIYQLPNTPLIYSCNKAGQEAGLRKPTEVYLSGKELEEYFSGNDKIYFTAPDLHAKFEKERLEPFLTAIGVADSPRRIKLENTLTEEEKETLRISNGIQKHNPKRPENRDDTYNLEGLDIFINKITLEKSVLLWSLVLRGIEKLSDWEAREYFMGKYICFSGRLFTITFDSIFLKTLKQEQWLFDKNGKSVKPSEVALFELPDEYIKDNQNIEILKKKLQFKSDAYDQLSPEDKKKLERIKGFSDDELEKMIAEHQGKPGMKQKEESDKIFEKWMPEFKPGEIDTPIMDAHLEKIDLPDRTGQSIGKEAIKTEEVEKHVEEKTSREVSRATFDPGEIGAWGEEHVFKELQKQYNGGENKIVPLNTGGKVGRGCDFIRKENGLEVEYIEVKSKLGSGEELIEITGPQWEFARKLHDSGQGHKYSIYIVSNTGQSNAKITKLNDPIGHWKQGKLYAHPIKFRL